MKCCLNLPAPAKLNLFLHVVGRKPDGMHLLESVFSMIDLCDYLDFEVLDEPQIIREGDIVGLWKRTSATEQQSSCSSSLLIKACASPFVSTSLTEPAWAAVPQTQLHA